jgi:hypothetical protein
MLPNPTRVTEFTNEPSTAQTHLHIGLPLLANPTFPLVKTTFWTFNWLFQFQLEIFFTVVTMQNNGFSKLDSTLTTSTVLTDKLLTERTPLFRVWIKPLSTMVTKPTFNFTVITFNDSS